MPEVTYGTLTHYCDDERCHVKDFVTTLQLGAPRPVASERGGAHATDGAASPRYPDMAVLDTDHGIELVCMTCNVIVGTWTVVNTPGAWPRLRALVEHAQEHKCEGSPDD